MVDDGEFVAINVDFVLKGKVFAINNFGFSEFSLV